MQIVQDPTPQLPQKTDDESQAPPPGKDIIERLQKGALPQMVDWFDPGLLAKVGMRSIISATLGQYTDQRLMQAASDNASEAELIARYDYSGTRNAKPENALAQDANGAVWIDYIADCGDGFEATYTVAYLLAPEELKVRGAAEPLPAGKLLIMGGDQVYPDATKQEYQSRLRDPYDWAFKTDNPQRKVFAIPGNHDWYDGLSAFCALFCSARDRISGGKGTQLGGWRCQQHRSYFAIKLPHNWWIWGPDIQLADNLDDSQRDYFDLMADQTDKGHNIILCLAEPSWLHKNYDNLHEISMLARKKGAKICAVIAGDWHHYSRYTNQQLGIQFITSGGGGAFTHATHGLKPRINLKWATPTGAGQRVASPVDPPKFNRSEESVIGPGGPDFTQKTVEVNAGDSGGQPTQQPPDTDVGGGRRAKAVRKEEINSNEYSCHVPHIYPPQWKSRLLSLKNLWLPFHNKRFAVLVGIVYFIYAWSWAAADPRQSPIMAKLSNDIEMVSEAAHRHGLRLTGELSTLKTRQQDLARAEAAVVGAQAPGTPAQPPSATAVRLEQDIAQKQAALDATVQEINLHEIRKIKLLGERDTLLGVDMLQRTKSTFEDKNTTIGHKLTSTVQTMIGVALAHLLDPQAFFNAAEQSPLFAFLLLSLWAALIYYVELPAGLLGILGKVIVGTVHFAAHIITLLIVAWVATGLGGILAKAFTGTTVHINLPNVIRQTYHEPSIWTDMVRVGATLLITLPIGGILGGLVMGLYWTLTSTLAKMHTGDAFGALGIKDYRNFLRIKLEPDRATIYAIALDKVPGRRGWRWELKKDEVRPAHNPQILPVKPLQPRLIEPPIAIDATKVLP